MTKSFNLFPAKKWEDMSSEEQDYYRGMDEKDIRQRWHTSEGKRIKENIIELNLKSVGKVNYSAIVGTVKTSWSKKALSRFDFRGIDFSNYSCLIEDTFYSFDFRMCSLIYSNFQDSVFDTASFEKADILYSNFSGASLEECNFQNSNLTLSNFNFARLDGSDFSSAWITNLQLKNSSLGYVKFSNKTDFHDLDIRDISGNANPFFKNHIKKKIFLNNFKASSRLNWLTYHVWNLTSACGHSFFRWLLTGLFTVTIFGSIYSMNSGSFAIANGRENTGFTYYYASTVIFTTLGFGDIIPKDLFGEIVVTIQVIIGYLMLGGLLSIFANKFIAKE